MKIVLGKGSEDMLRKMAKWYSKRERIGELLEEDCGCGGAYIVALNKARQEASLTIANMFGHLLWCVDDENIDLKLMS